MTQINLPTVRRILYFISIGIIMVGFIAAAIKN